MPCSWCGFGKSASIGENNSVTFQVDRHHLNFLIAYRGHHFDGQHVCVFLTALQWPPSPCTVCAQQWQTVRRLTPARSTLGGNVKGVVWETKSVSPQNTYRNHQNNQIHVSFPYRFCSHPESEITPWAIIFCCCKVCREAIDTLWHRRSWKAWMNQNRTSNPTVLTGFGTAVLSPGQTSSICQCISSRGGQHWMGGESSVIGRVSYIDHDTHHHVSERSRSYNGRVALYVIQYSMCDT